MDEVIFRNQEHVDFYEKMIKKCRCQDVYHQALVYCLGIDRDTRAAVESIYDFEAGNLKTECLNEGWITSGSAKIIRLAFNLYNNGTPSIYDYEDPEDKLRECQRYTVEDLLCCGYLKYFWEAVKIRYPEYCS